VSGVRPCSGHKKRFPEYLPSPLNWRFSGVSAESLRVRPLGGFVVTSRPAGVRGCGCRSGSARLATHERLPGRHRPARARPSRWVDHGRNGRTAAPTSVFLPTLVQHVCRPTSTRMLNRFCLFYISLLSSPLFYLYRGYPSRHPHQRDRSPPRPALFDL